jgi:hypothetical protein
MKTMKTLVPLLLSFLLSVSIQAQNKFLPGPSADLQTVPSGSYVIAMDNTLQTNTAGYFNLKLYGLICHLLNNNIKLKWVIRAGKTKDGIDFSAPAEQIQPSFIAGSSKDFKAGPFVIYAPDTTGVAALIKIFYTSNGLTGSNRPRVYRLTAAAVNADIRFDMAFFKPKVAILDDGKNTDIHLDYMTICSIPSYNYTTGLGGIDLLTRCFTFASEPHNDASSPATIAAIRRFVEYGGNFLAQCRAVEAYENSPQGRFHTSTGISVTNSNISTAATIYPNSDLSYTQFEGIFDISNSGSVKNWTLSGGSSFVNNAHNHGTGGIMGAQNPIGASVSKLTSPASPGGLVFYLGNHSFSSVTNYSEINGIRMYMNAMLTPNAINIYCNTGDSLSNPLPVKLTSFNVNLSQDQSKTNLTWTTATEINTNHFIVERSTDGVHYNEMGMVFANGNTNEQKNYQYTDNISAVNATLTFYRIRSVDIDGKSEYSATRSIRIDKQTDNNITILAFPNPVTNELSITIPPNWQNKKITYELYSANGQVTKKSENSSSNQTETMNVNSLPPGFYMVRVICNGEAAQQKIIKR